ncbi:MAG: hypothetical protein Fur0021_30600 [Candidatus Promineifilaceae bacterium]
MTIAPWQRIPERMATLGLTAEDGMTKVWFVSAAGKLDGGAAAVNAALRNVWWARPLTLFYRLPGFQQLEDWLYQWVADHRQWMPGSTAACALPSANAEKRTKSS